VALLAPSDKQVVWDCPWGRKHNISYMVNMNLDWAAALGAFTPISLDNLCPLPFPLGRL